MDFNSIGYFQFDNLIQSRVPMVLLVLEDIPVASWYKSVTLMHLENIMIRCESSEVLGLIAEKNLPPHYAIVILDNQATLAPSLVAELETRGHLNAYYVAGGWLGICSEKNQNQ